MNLFLLCNLKNESYSVRNSYLRISRLFKIKEGVCTNPGFFLLLTGMGNNRRERSRSPMRIDNGGRRRDIKPDISKSSESSIPVINPIMMANMYPQGKVNNTPIINLFYSKFNQ